MRKRSNLTVVWHFAAPPQRVWDVLVDHEGMPRWTPLRRVTLEPPGQPERNGVGAVRVLHAFPGYVIREEITRFEAPYLLGYTLRGGMPTSDHHGRITVAPNGENTVLTWTVGFVSSVPGMTMVVTALIKGTLVLLGRHVRRTATGR